MGLSSFILLLLVWHGCAEFITFNHLGIELLIDTDSCQDRACNSGTFCNSDCTGIEVCLNDKFVCNLAQCFDGNHCDSEKRQCVADKENVKWQCLESYQFQCVDTGYFPDPFSCDHYYCCDSLNKAGEKIPCPEGTKYDPKIQACREGYNCIEPIVPACQGNQPVTQCDQLPSDEYIFYTCITNGTVPVLNNCESGIFDKTSCKCIGSTVSSRVSVPACPSSLSSSSSSSPSVQTTTPAQTISCAIPHVFYPVSDNCHYCYCTEYRTCIIKRCSPGTHFDSGVGTCVYGGNCS